MTSAYLIVKFVHVLAVVIWIGGLIMVSALASAVGRDAAAMRAFSGAVTGATKVLMMPSAIITILTGLIMMMQLGGKPPFWMLWGLIVAPMTIVIGAVFTRKTGEAMSAAMSSANPDPAVVAALQSKFRTLSRVNIVLLVSIIAAMVLKPVF